MKFRPAFNKIIVKREAPKTQTDGGILLPDSAKIVGVLADVLAVGKGRTLPTGKEMPIPAEVGDKVLLSVQGGTEVEFDGEQCVLVDFDDVLATVIGAED